MMDIREAFIEVEGLQIFYRSGGQGDIPTVLIHGGGSDHSGFAWKPVLNTLTRSLSIIAIDLPGYGRSDHPSLQGQNPFPFHIDFFPKILDRLGIEKLNLVGLSMGGGISIGFALRHPERIRRLVLVDSYALDDTIPGGKMTWLASRMPLQKKFLRPLLQQNRFLVKMGLYNLFHDRKKVTDDLVDDAVQALNDAGQHPIWEAFIDHEITSSGALSTFYEQLPSLAVEPLLIHGDTDRLFPLPGAKKAAERIPNSQLHIFENCGHLPPREMPEKFCEVVVEYLLNGKR